MKFHCILKIIYGNHVIFSGLHELVPCLILYSLLLGKFFYIEV